MRSSSASCDGDRHAGIGAVAVAKGQRRRLIGHGVLFGQAAGDLDVVVVADAGLDLDINVALGGGHAGVGVGCAGRVGRDEDVVAADDRCAGDGQGVGGAGHLDLGGGVHTGQQLAKIVDPDGDGVSGGAAGGGARRGDVGHHAVKGLVLDGVGGDPDVLPLFDREDLQLVHVQGHFQVAQVVDDAHGGGRSGGALIAHRLPCLDVLLDDGAADGRGDGVVVQGVHGVLHRQLGAAQAVGSLLHLAVQAVAGQLDDVAPRAHHGAGLDAEGRHGAAGCGGEGLLFLVGEPGRAQGVDPAHRGGGRLGGGQAAAVGHRDDHRAHQHIAVAQGVGPRDRADRAGQSLVGAVQGDLGGLAGHEGGGVRRREVEGQQDGPVVTDGGDLLAGRDGVPRGHPDGDHGAADVAAHIAGVEGVLIAALGLVGRDLGPLHAVGGVRAVDGVQDVPGLDHVALGEVGGEDGAPHQRPDLIGVGRRDGARIAEHIDDLPPLRADLDIVDAARGGRGLVPGQEQGCRHHHDHSTGRDPLPVALEERFRPFVRGSGSRAEGHVLAVLVLLLFFLKHG